MDPYKVLFVCWGNICRSPAAHCVFQKKINERGLEDQIACDSAGTINAHAGNSPDSRMQKAGARRSIPFFGHSRKYQTSDFHEFDLILAMDHSNLADLESAWPSDDCRAELKLFGQFVNADSPPEVPDPYYGGSQGFDIVLDMVEEGCDQLIEHILNR
ncbi:MAG: low molecular weight phosphotyrosine protein phosphatase [Opitutales bacterium]|jgi:protein-tyrosine phosphatase|nr:low molecular weight phosphotyrosine protein phosphatase [Opitutales bacterium]